MRDCQRNASSKQEVGILGRQGNKVNIEMSSKDIVLGSLEE
jgi:hypothetical protein